MDSLLDIIKKEDLLIKQRENNFERKVSLLHAIDDIEMHPRVYALSLDDVPRYREELNALEKREAELDEELKKTRKHLCIYLLDLFRR